MTGDIKARMRDLLDDVRHDNYDTEQAALDALVALADQHVAAELRRLAASLDVIDRTVRSSGLASAITVLRTRADELDGGAA
ncbi:MAG TPA: hypothetical protein VIQ30_04905 [Pseudonocardia sp.]